MGKHVNIEFSGKSYKAIELKCKRFVPAFAEKTDAMSEQCARSNEPEVEDEFDRDIVLANVTMRLFRGHIQCMSYIHN